MSLLDFERILLIVFEATALCAGISTWKKYRYSPVQKTTIYLALVVLFEIAGNVMARYKLKEENGFLFSYIVIPMEYLFFFWLFYKTFQKRVQKNIVIVSTIVFTGSIIYEKLFINAGTKLHFMSLSYSVCNILLLLIIIMYLAAFIKSEQILYFKRNPVFWIAIGLLVFYLGSFPLFAMYNYLWEINQNLFRIYWHIVFILNCMMYSLFSIAFIWGKPTLTYSS